MTSKSVAEQKAAARKIAFAARKAAHDPERCANANSHLIAFLNTMPQAKVAAYMAIRTEVDPKDAMGHHARSGQVAVPVITGKAQPLEFHLWTPHTDMVDGPFGAAVPADKVEMEPDLVILPLVAFDTNGTRLGYGGGFYDRTLEKLRRLRPVPAIGFAYAAQEMPSLPKEPTDLPLDAIITESGLRQF